MSPSLNQEFHFSLTLQTHQTPADMLSEEAFQPSDPLPAPDCLSATENTVPAAAVEEMSEDEEKCRNRSGGESVSTLPAFLSMGRSDDSWQLQLRYTENG